MKFWYRRISPNILNELKIIQSSEFEDVLKNGEYISRLGVYSHKHKVISLNRLYFGRNVSENNKAKLEKGTFRTVLLHGLDYYYFETYKENYNLLELYKKIYDGNNGQIYQVYKELEDNGIKGDELIKEIHAIEFSRYSEEAIENFINFYHKDLL